MKTLFLCLALTVLHSHAATVTLLTPTPYIRFTDSPFYDAAAAGDALKFASSGCNDPATNLANGYGVHDDFIDNDCLSPWVLLTRGEFRLGGGAVDEDNGVQGDPGGWYIFGVNNLAIRAVEIVFDFVPTSDGKYPMWAGFVLTGAGTEGPVKADIIGAGDSILATINLSSIIPPYTGGAVTAYHRFVGFTSDTPVYRIHITGTALIDDLTYGYGTPIPEPSPLLTGGVLALAAGLRRRRMRP